MTRVLSLPPASQSQPAPIFIVGAARSGTTLTGKILGRHPQIAAPGESHYFEDIWARRRELGALNTESSLRPAMVRLQTLYGRYNSPETQRLVDDLLEETCFVQEVLAAGGGYAALYDRFMTLLATASGKPRFCDDTPKHLFFLSDIFQLFPNAKVIGCVRDSRDFLCSYKNYWRRSTESARIRALYHPIITAMLWRSSARRLVAGTAQYSKDRLALVRYESLVNSPEQEIQRLADFLEIAYSPAMLTISGSNSSFEEEAQGIFTLSVGRWRDCLEPHEVYWGQAIARPQMAQFGYHPERTKASWFRTVMVLLQTPAALIRALRANRHKRGPTGQYLFRRLRSMFGR